MHIYYHVVQFEKGKKCTFHFSYIRSGNMYILGSVVVDLSGPQRSVIFDGESDIQMKREEKDEIVGCVLRSLQL